MDFSTSNILFRFKFKNKIFVNSQHQKLWLKKFREIFIFWIALSALTTILQSIQKILKKSFIKHGRTQYHHHRTWEVCNTRRDIVLLAMLCTSSLYVVHKTVMAALYLLFSRLFSGGSEVATLAVVAVFNAAQNYLYLYIYLSVKLYHI